MHCHAFFLAVVAGSICCGFGSPGHGPVPADPFEHAESLGHESAATSHADKAHAESNGQETRAPGPLTEPSGYAESFGYVPAAGSHADKLHAEFGTEDAKTHNMVHAKGHVKAVDSAETLAIAHLLLAWIVFLMVMAYLANCVISRVRSFTWGLVSATLSIFCAVMLFEAAQNTCELIFGKETPWLFLVGVFVMQVLLCALRLYRVAHHALGIIFGHAAGFGCIYFFAYYVERDPYRHDPNSRLEAALVGLLALPFFLLMFWLGDLGRKTLLRGASAACKDDGSSMSEDEASDLAATEDVQRWEAICKEVEVDAAGLCLGLICSQTVRCAILGYMPALKGEHKERSPRDTVLLFGIGWLFVLLSAVINRCRRSKRAHRFERVAHFVETVANMTMAWCTIFSGEWFFFYLFHPASAMVMKVSLAFMMSVLCGAFVLSAVLLEKVVWLQCLGRHGLKADVSLKALGLIVGLSWEKAFDESVHVTMGHQHANWSIVAMQLLLVGIVGPAWGYTVLPVANRELANVHTMFWETFGDPNEDDWSSLPAPFESIDANRDGIITREEYEARIKHQESHKNDSDSPTDRDSS